MAGAQTGRRGVRPPGPGGNPLVLGIIAALWIAGGVSIGLYVHGSWRYIPAIFACGIGVVFLRSAAGAYVQRLRSQSRE
ncbi:MAG: hypothetical protein ACYCWN_11770 [Ferrimicrobium sp.]|uniref:DUF2530 domain-containing protein n=1 Tax=Ferrimicrobium acidiphilum TaxID=121039 RepID=A0ABV3Y543_9ACTN|nr:hypothetical protein [Ferrimicrobium sp.]MCL5973224.1 hypothetical protein [Actinomycetota bacterium]